MKFLQDFLETPSVESWKAIVKIGRACAEKAIWQKFAEDVLAALPSWPKELQRLWPDGVGPPEFKEQVEWRIKETDTYGHYIQRICGDPRLQIDGKQRVWLERRFTGGVVPASSAKQVIATLLEADKCKRWAPIREAISVLAGSIRNTGKTGTADLTGGLILRHTRKGISRVQECQLSIDQLYQAGVNTPSTTETQGNVIEVRLELEVKVGDGKQRPDQIARQNSVTNRGGLYLLCRSVEEAIQGILNFIAAHE